jgi:site-specific DNA-methyltransferase (adenine-specific)
MTGVTILHGDCVEQMRTLADKSVDSIVTDPPYHLTNAGGGPKGDNPYSRSRAGAGTKGFMGKEWDGGDIAFRPETWVEALRVLKPGGHMLAFSGSRTYHRMVCAIEDAGFEIRDQIMWIYGSGFPKSKNLDGAWEGWGTALKPAHEPIVVARKPLVGTVAANVLQHGTGALNIGGCRVGSEGTIRTQRGTTKAWEGGAFSGEVPTGSDAGRWPANIIHDGSDEVLAAFPQAPGQMAKAAEGGDRRKDQNVFGAMTRGSNGAAPRIELDTSAARFFYCAKANRGDRNDGLPSGDAPAVLTNATMRERETADWQARNGNHHPTVKPTELMRYLCRLVTPTGGLVLDPFMGSGSTGRGAVLEGFRFVGIEREADYLDIARARIAAAQAAAVETAAEAATPRTLSLFPEDAAA